MVRILGNTRTGRRRRYQLGALVSLVALLAVLAVPNAFAVHDTGKFQLDGDAEHETQPIGPAATDDWDNVCHQVTVTQDTTNAIPDQCTSDPDTSGATAVAWSAEPSPNSSFFTGGGSKDPQDMSAWAWKDLSGGLPDKDNLEHGFAVRYSLPIDRVDTVPPGSGDLGNGTACPAVSPATTCELVFFGSDRFDNSGDAQQGVWFLQNKITLGSNKIGGGTGFACQGSCSSGFHRNGDVLVVSDFSNGGGTSTISVYTWDTNCTATNKPSAFCADANLHLQETSDAANCASVGAGDAFCGIVNPSTISMPWSFTDKSATPSNGALNGEFYEAGINLSQFPGLSGECFSSTLDESRSSTSTTATLKDFVLSSFGQCVPNLVTTPSVTALSTVDSGTAVTDKAVFTGTGAANPPNPTSPPNVVFAICGPLSSSSTLACDGSDSAHTAATFGTSKPWVHCTGAGTPAAFCTAADPQGTSEAQSDSVSKTAPGIYCFKATWAGDINYPTGATDIGSAGSECYKVKDTSAVTTVQNWVPNDSAHVTTGSGAAASGNVTFVLYNNGTCDPGTSDANVLATFGPTAVNGSGNASTNNTTTYVAVQPGATISWLVTFTPSDTDAVGGSSSSCESSVLTINNNPNVP